MDEWRDLFILKPFYLNWKSMKSMGLFFSSYSKNRDFQTEKLFKNLVNLIKFLKDKLKLSINRESGIRRPVNFTILGFSFVPTYVKGERGKYQLVVSDKSWRKLKQKLKIITKKDHIDEFR